MDINGWILYFGVPVGAFILFFIYQAYKNKKTTLGKIRDSFGQKSRKNYIYEEFESISHGFYHLQNNEDYIDDITWNDLNMDEIYKDMDSACSSLGQEALYRMLRSSSVDDTQLKERKRLMDYFAEHEKERVDLSYLYSGFGYSKRMSVADYIESLKECRKKPVLPQLGFLALLIAALVYCLAFDAVKGMWAVIIAAVFNIVMYFRFKADIEVYFMCIKQVFSMCSCAKKISGLDIEGIEEYSRQLDGLVREFSGVLRFSWILSSGSGGALEFFLDYIRMLTHLDIVKFYRVINTLNEKKETVWKLYGVLGYLDALMAASSYRACLPYYCEPQFEEKSVPSYCVKELYHPLIDNPVTNSVSAGGSVLITGSNASGKSTFLRSAGIAALLAQTLFFTTAREYRAARFRIYSSMALNDSLMNSESYYMVEIKSLKRILDAAGAGGGQYPVLCFIDEVLRGTNTVERIAASSQILKRLAGMHTICFAATHDIELTGILERHFSNYHFSEQITDNDITFNYKLEKGRAASRNAIKLLGLLGYEKAILDRAAEAAEYFEEKGVWRQEP